MVIVGGNQIGEPKSTSQQSCMRFTSRLCPKEESMNPSLFHPAIGK